MDKLSNSEQVSAPTRSTVADWSGLQPILDPTPNDLIEVQDKTLSDPLVNADRMYCITAGQTISFPSVGGVRIYNPLSIMWTSNTLLAWRLNYANGFAWDSLDVTISLTDPKGVAGGLIVGWYPYRDWFETQFTDPAQFAAVEADRHSINPMAKERLTLSPESQLMLYGQSADVKFNIPWQLPRSHLDVNDWVNRSNGHVCPTIGMPLIYFYNIANDSVSTQAVNPEIKVFLSFNNFRTIGPVAHSYFNQGLADDGFPPDHMFKRQSGAEVAAVAAAAEATVAAGVEIVSRLAGKSDDDNYVDEAYGTYEKPTAVQLSFAGDTTAVGPPEVTPMFSRYLSNQPKRHPILKYLQRPQYIGTVSTSTQSATFYADPMAPVGNRMSGASMPCTYFRWYGQCAQYWRGTIMFDFVIMGHPMVEVEYTLTLDYPSSSYFAQRYADRFGDQVICRGIVAGPKRITVPMPFVTGQDMLFVLDGTDVAEEARLAGSIASILAVNFRVKSTMLDVVPTLHAAVFISAGSDFAFYGFQPPGLYNLDNDLDDRAAKPLKRQVGLPLEAELFETRAVSQAPIPSMPAIVDIEDFMERWCRCLPYENVDSNDEPQPLVSLANFPAWISPGESAAWTADVNNSWYVTNDYISLFSSQFMLYQGSIGCKAICVYKDPGSEGTWKFASLGMRTNVSGRQRVHNPYTLATTMIPASANFGVGAVITPNSSQPVLEFTIPFKSQFSWEWVSPIIDYSRPGSSSIGYYQYKMDYVSSNVLLQVPGSDLVDALHRKIGSDYRLAVEGLLPPAPLWMAKGSDWLYALKAVSVSPTKELTAGKAKKKKKPVLN